MSNETNVIRKAALEDYSASLDAKLAGARTAVRESAGARKALATHVANMVNLQQAARHELVPDGVTESQLADAKLVLSWLDRARTATVNFHDAFRNRELMEQGVVQTLEQLQADLGKRIAVEAAAEPEREAPLSLKQEREQEEAALVSADSPTVQALTDKIAQVTERLPDLQLSRRIKKAQPAPSYVGKSPKKRASKKA